MDGFSCRTSSSVSLIRVRRSAPVVVAEGPGPLDGSVFMMSTEKKKEKNRCPGELC